MAAEQRAKNPWYGSFAISAISGGFDDIRNECTDLGEPEDDGKARAEIRQIYPAAQLQPRLLFFNGGAGSLQTVWESRDKVDVELGCYATSLETCLSDLRNAYRVLAQRHQHQFSLRDVPLIKPLDQRLTYSARLRIALINEGVLVSVIFPPLVVLGMGALAAFLRWTSYLQAEAASGLTALAALAYAFIRAEYYQ